MKEFSSPISRADFTTLAASYRAIPVMKKVLADVQTPVSAFMHGVQEEEGFILESAENEKRWNRFSFIGRRPHAIISSVAGQVSIEGDLPVTDIPVDKGIFAVVEYLLEVFNAPEFEDVSPLTAGLVGYFGYDVVREVEELDPPPGTETADHPDSRITVLRDLAVFDHWKQQLVFISVALLPENPSEEQINNVYDQAIDTLEKFITDVNTPLAKPSVSPPVSSNMEVDSAPFSSSSLSDLEYMQAVEAAKEYIAAGDIFQVVLSKRFDFDLAAEPIDMYRVLRQINPSSYMYFLKNDSFSLVGCSPEPLVQVQGSRVAIRPIAGTRPRGATEREDQLLEAELVENPKEIAEHIMLIDLARNDLGRVVEYGSLQIEEKMIVEKYSHVMHLTSQVSGIKRSDKSVIDVLKATIPAGTVSGAPKVRAMEIIDELEPARRGSYAGVVGYIDFSGNIDTAIAIRTMFCSEGRNSVQAGAGVVTDSVPADENEECLNKAKALLSAIKPAELLYTERTRGVSNGRNG